ncbi:TPA: hypothetical protein QDE31_37610 [Burkholderia cenocepacia]|nr:hypothetical protein [Burkholderia cenocepacia]HDR9875424.1 hypothetical protein [Burkholderia cenocepacia]
MPIALNANQCKGTGCLVNDSYNADMEHSVFCQFEHFCAVNGLSTERYDMLVGGTRFISDVTEFAWKAFTWKMDPQPIWPA